MAQRKTPQQVAQENLDTAERVHEKAVARVDKLKADYDKAVADEAFAARRVRAARMLALDEDVAADVDPEPTPAAPPAAGKEDDDVL